MAPARLLLGRAPLVLRPTILPGLVRWEALRSSAGHLDTTYIRQTDLITGLPTRGLIRRSRPSRLLVRGVTDLPMPTRLPRRSNRLRISGKQR